MNEPSSNKRVKEMMSASVRAVTDLRREIGAGWFSRLLSFLERRREFKQRIRERAAALARCREGYHESKNWRPWETTPILANVGDRIPLGKRAAWTAFCTHCGKPISTNIKTYE